MIGYWVTLVIGFIITVISLRKIDKDSNANIQYGMQYDNELLVADLVKEVTKTKEELRQESDNADKKIFELTQLQEETNEKIKELKQLQEAAIKTQEPIKTQETSEAKAIVSSYEERYKEIDKLSKQGFTLTEISKKTGKDKGEINFILNLISQSVGVPDDEN